MLHVPERFEKVVATHVFKNIAPLDVFVPLILGIHGPSGEGKTKQCEIILERMRVELVVISGGELEHKQAGRPGELIRDRYLEASDRFEPSRGRVCALLINDFDTGVGIWGSENERAIFQYTINLQNVYATLMNIVDHPTSVDGKPCNRVPIIITGNEFTILHKPLIRDGRMTKFRWVPTSEEKVKIIQILFSDVAVSSHGLTEFVTRYINRPVAFFAHIKSTLIDETVAELIRNIGLEELTQYAISRPFSSTLGNIRYTIENLELAASNVERQDVSSGTKSHKEEL